jgi:type I restriction enzyme S subunit
MTTQEGWHNKSLRQLATINYGRSPVQILADDGIYPVVGTGGAERLGNDYLHDGDSIILGRKGTIDRVHFVTGRFWAIDTAYFLSDFSESLPRWLFYFLQTLDLRQLNEATGVPSLSRELLYKIEIPTPPKPEQTKIAEILSTVDRAIEQTEALIAKQQRIKTGLMHDLLTRGIDEHGNLRSEQTHAFKDSSLGRIPVEWQVTPANELCDAVLDCKNRTPPAASEGHPVIRTPNVRGGEFVFHDLAYTDPLSYETWVTRGKPRAGDVVITREAPFGEVCQIPDDLFAPCLGQRMMMYQTSPAKLRPDYLVYAICSEAVQTRLLELAGGSTVGHIRVGDIRRLSIPHPISVEEQGNIAAALTGSGTTLKNLRVQRRKLTLIKTALMQDLLTGKKRVTPLLESKLTH